MTFLAFAFANVSILLSGFYIQISINDLSLIWFYKLFLLYEIH